jgi:hypothetical protein
MSDSTAEERYDWPIRGRFRKQHQPYAVRICAETLDEIAKYDDCQIMLAGPKHPDKEPGAFLKVVVETTEGKLTIKDGWIAEDSQGEHYPISHDEFRRIYEPVE